MVICRIKRQLARPADSGADSSEVVTVQHSDPASDGKVEMLLSAPPSAAPTCLRGECTRSAMARGQCLMAALTYFVLYTCERQAENWGQLHRRGPARAGAPQGPLLQELPIRDRELLGPDVDDGGNLDPLPHSACGSVLGV